MTAGAGKVNLDQIVDYRAEYSGVVEKPHYSGDKLTGLCPFHDDRNNSFSVDLKTGKWKCHAGCGGGNFITFWAKLHGLNLESHEAYKQILDRYHVSTEPQKQTKEELQSYSVDQYAFEKRPPPSQ